MQEKSKWATTVWGILFNPEDKVSLGPRLVKILHFAHEMLSVEKLNISQGKKK